MNANKISEIDLKELLRGYAEQYNDEIYFKEDPIFFPKYFYKLFNKGDAKLQDIEIAAIFSAHLAWGRRDMIVRDSNRVMDEMSWKPYDYILNGEYRDENCSMHRTIKWCDFADICRRLRNFYKINNSLETLSQDEIRVQIYGQKSDLKAANKKINMMRRWMVRDDGKVDLGVWKSIDKRDLIIPLDVHVHRSALNLGLTNRNSTDFKTAREITDFLLDVFPSDPLLGDFALFGSSISKK